MRTSQLHTSNGAFSFVFPTVPWSLLQTVEAQVTEVTTAAAANHQQCVSTTGPPQYCKYTTIRSVLSEIYFKS